jgi:pimeloyl-ACP methyl ester carboxylesterase
VGPDFAGAQKRAASTIKGGAVPFLDLKGGRIYFEVHGQGAPLLFLNGIMMSTVSWSAFVPVLSRKFQLILADFRDQGQSSRMNEPYGLDVHVEDMAGLLDHLEISRAHVTGISYGGQVALRLALSHPEKLRSLCLFNTPSRISRRLIEIGKAWETAAALDDGYRFFQLALPFIYSEPFYEAHMDFLEERRKVFQSMLTREWFEAFVRLSRSAERFSVSSAELQTVAVPTLLAGSDLDAVVSPDAMRDIRENVPGCESLIIPGSGHASCLEKMNEFLTIAIGFAAKHS